jgi:preprotein translocase subunit SecD
MLGKARLFVMAVSALAIGFAADHSPGSNARPGVAPVPSLTSGHLLITLQLSPAKLSHPRPGAAARTQGRAAISDSQIAQTKRVLAARITGYGLSEPTIQTEKVSGVRLVVDIPSGRRDTQTITALKSLLTSPGQLEFLAIPHEYGHDHAGPAVTRVDGRQVFTFTRPDGREVPTDVVIARSQRLVTSSDFERDALVISRPGQPTGVSFRLKESARPAFREFTGEHIGTRLAMVLDGRMLSCPVIKAAITGEGVILSDFEEPGGQERAKQLAIMINSGPLPLRVAWVKGQYVLEGR